MDINTNIESPFIIKASFNKLLTQYETLRDADNEFIAYNARRVLKIAEDHPILRDGFSDYTIFNTHKAEIKGILQDIFSPLLTHNEIKIAAIPFHAFIFNVSERFESILNEAGESFELEMKNMPKEQAYIMACGIILNACYGYDLKIKRPFYYEIPDAKGVIRYYKIMYNADFTEIIPKAGAPKITEDDFDELLDNFENIDLWKEKFPPQSYIFKGFVIANIFDITDDQSISNIKTSLIGSDKRQSISFMTNIESVFRSLLGIKNLNVGFSTYNKENGEFESVMGIGTHSYLLNGIETKKCSEALCTWSYNRLLNENNYFSISNVDKLYNESTSPMPHIVSLFNQGIKSAIFAPIANKDGLMGILEIVSDTPKALNSISSNRLKDIMPFLVSAVERSKKEEENLIQAVIQKECTSIHSSVHWKFEQEARRYIKSEYSNEEVPTFRKIAFENVYPLFGQMDVKGSSEARNEATQKDLALQLSLAEHILDKTLQITNLPIFQQIKFQISEFNAELKENFKVDSEHEITVFLKDEVNPVFHLIAQTEAGLKDDVDDYFGKMDTELDVVYYYRKHYDDSVKLINTNMSSLLDDKQAEAQNMYPHFFERFNTDGVEHNMYIGESITKADSFNMIYLYNLRLWQLQVMCEMENEYYQKQDAYPIALDVASMILVFNQPLSIRFRMDEKRFDVDGTYNARYEVVKKRVDKAFIKGTKERVTEKGKLTIVYSQKEDEEEYVRYIKFLQSKNILDKDLEFLELEDLQGITGLKALRISLLYHKEQDHQKFYTYEDLMETIKA